MVDTIFTRSGEGIFRVPRNPRPPRVSAGEDRCMASTFITPLVTSPGINFHNYCYQMTALRLFALPEVALTVDGDQDLYGPVRSLLAHGLDGAMANAVGRLLLPLLVRAGDLGRAALTPGDRETSALLARVVVRRHPNQTEPLPELLDERLINALFFEKNRSIICGGRGDRAELLSAVHSLNVFALIQTMVARGRCSLRR